jgi:hypothetical protein
VAQQQAQHHHLALRVAEQRHRPDDVPGRGLAVARTGDPARPAGLEDGVAGHGDQPGAGLALAPGDHRQPGQGAPEDLPGRVPGRRAVAGPGEQVAEDALDLVVVEPRERLAVAGRRPFEQRALARHLGGHVAVPAGAGEGPGVRGADESGGHRVSG